MGWTPGCIALPARYQHYRINASGLVLNIRPLSACTTSYVQDHVQTRETTLILRHNNDNNNISEFQSYYDIVLHHVTLEVGNRSEDKAGTASQAPEAIMTLIIILHK